MFKEFVLVFVLLLFTVSYYLFYIIYGISIDILSLSLITYLLILKCNKFSINY